MRDIMPEERRLPRIPTPLFEKLGIDSVFDLLSKKAGYL
jgi:hypothetical protein